MRSFSRAKRMAAFALLAAISVPVLGQFGVPGGPGRFNARELYVHDRFDTDSNGVLDDRERQHAREYVRSERNIRGGVDSSSHRRVAVGDSSLSASRSAGRSTSRASTAGIEAGTEAGLYDENVLRSLYLTFPFEDWYAELGDFYRTDVEIPADLAVDGELYRGVGVSFRGNSSYFSVAGPKKSFNISVNYSDDEQRLYGYRTLNLLNAHSDPSFVREVLYSRICRNYIPAMKANLVRLFINGEDWGIYVNVQQFNNDFLNEWYGTSAGARWKVPAGMSRSGGLTYLGDNFDAYRSSYQIKSADDPDSWRTLVAFVGALNQTPDEDLVSVLEPLLDIDEALWFIALENVFTDSDGYLSRGADFSIYLDPSGRFHLVSHDNNETFRFAGGGGPNMWPSGEPLLSVTAQEDNPRLPIVSRLLAIPELRSRYLADVQEIVDEWLDWKTLVPLIDGYRDLIDGYVRADTKKLYSYEAFTRSFEPASRSAAQARWRIPVTFVARLPALRSSSQRVARSSSTSLPPCKAK